MTETQCIEVHFHMHPLLLLNEGPLSSSWSLRSEELTYQGFSRIMGLNLVTMSIILCARAKLVNGPGAKFLVAKPT
jgi:hypothetical protein